MSSPDASIATDVGVSSEMKSPDLRQGPENIVFEVLHAVMSIKLPLNEMTVQEKLAAMEALWEDAIS